MDSKLPDSKKTKVRLIEDMQALRRTLRANEETLRSAQLESKIIASAVDVIVIIDEGQNIVQFNPAAEHLFGHSRGQVVGQPFDMLFPEQYRESHHRLIQMYIDLGIMTGAKRSLEILTGRQADGSVFPLEASISPIAMEGRKYFAVILRDVSQRENLENLIMRQYDSLNTLYLVTLDLLNQRDIRDLLQFIVDEAVKLLEVSYCEILLPDGNDLVAQAFTRDTPFRAGNRFSREEGPLSWRVLDTGLPVILEDYSASEQRHKIYEAEQFHAAAVLPLLVRNQCIGVLGMTREVPGYKFSEEQILTATRLAAIVALAIENSRLYLEVKRLATTDELTGVHNRRNLMDIGERDVQRALRYDRPLSALMIDVDHFKRINDTEGHSMGDIVLHEVAQEIVQQIRRSDAIGRYEVSADSADNVIGRFGGEEFGIILPETSIDGALIVAERIRASVENLSFNPVDNSGELNENPGAQFHVTVSIGASLLSSKQDTLANLLGRADQALYAAKQAGRNRVHANTNRGQVST
jgi:PAS domain S-box-containing protein